MRPKERGDSGQRDLFRSRLDQIVNLQHALVKLSKAIDWGFLEQQLGTVYDDEPGRPPLPTRLMAGLAILKHMHNLSDEVLCERWVENPYYQLFCGEEFFQHTLPFDRSSLTRWRQRMGEDKLIALMQESLATAVRVEAAKPADFKAVIVDTTVQEKAISFPTDAKLMQRARERLVKLAKLKGVALRQSYERVGKQALIKYQRYHTSKLVWTMPSSSSAPIGNYAGCAPSWVGRSATSPARSPVRASISKACRPCSLIPCRWPGGSRISAGASVVTRSIPCMPRKSNASARAKPTSPMSLA